MRHGSRLRGRRTCGSLGAIAWSVLTGLALVATDPVLAQAPGGCNTPVSHRPSEIGCYFTASEALGVVGQGPVFWHLYTYPTRGAAEAAKGAHGTVVESFGQVWLYRIAEERWRPAGGERVAVIGPLAVTSGKHYTARYMEAVFVPGMKSAIHRHSGPEAWYVLGGAQCPRNAERDHRRARGRRRDRAARATDGAAERGNGDARLGASGAS